MRSLLFGTQIASQYVQPHIGGDLALLTGIAKDVIERSGHDKKFIAEHTEGFEDFLQTVQATSWNEIVTQSGVDRDTIRGIADQYVNAKMSLLLGAWELLIIFTGRATFTLLRIWLCCVVWLVVPMQA